MLKAVVNELVKKVGQDDDDAFEELYLLLYRPLSVFIQDHLFNSIMTVEDVLQKTFLIVIEKSREKLYYKNCFGWIYAIAFNVCRNKTMADGEITVDFSEEMNFEKAASANFEDDIVLVTTIKTLKPEDQILVHKRYWEDKTFDRLAEELHTSPSDLKRRMIEIHKRLGILLSSEDKKT